MKQTAIWRDFGILGVVFLLAGFVTGHNALQTLAIVVGVYALCAFVMLFVMGVIMLNERRESVSKRFH